MIGGNNIYEEKPDTVDIVEGIMKVVDQVRKKQPNATIAIIVSVGGE